MEYYLAVRMRRFGRVFRPAEAGGQGNGSGQGRSEPSLPRPMGFRTTGPTGMTQPVGVAARGPATPGVTRTTSTMTRTTGRGTDRY